MRSTRGSFNILLRLVARGEVADGEDHFVCVQAHKVPRCLFAEADVGSGDDDGLAREVDFGSWVLWNNEQLVVDEAHNSLVYIFVDAIYRSAEYLINPSSEPDHSLCQHSDDTSSH